MKMRRGRRESRLPKFPQSVRRAFLTIQDLVQTSRLIEQRQQELGERPDNFLRDSSVALQTEIATRWHLPDCYLTEESADYSQLTVSFGIQIGRETIPFQLLIIVGERPIVSILGRRTKPMYQEALDFQQFLQQLGWRTIGYRVLRHWQENDRSFYRNQGFEMAKKFGKHWAVIVIEKITERSYTNRERVVYWRSEGKIETPSCWITESLNMVS